jgi:uncharacterized repeat protein (TIGR01451 family)
MLVLGVLGLFGLMRGLAQTDAPALKLEELKPTNYPATPAVEAPKAATPMKPPPGVPEPLPIAPPDAPKVLPPVMPPSDLVLPPVVEPEPAAVNVKKDKAPVDSPKAEPIKIEPLAPPVVVPPMAEPRKDPPKPDPFTNPMPPQVEPSRQATPPSGRTMPTVSIETISPESTPFGQPVNYEIVVKNHSSTPVTNVRVDEELVGGAQIISTEPAGEASADKAQWTIGTLNAGEEKRIKLSVKPGPEGDLCSKPRVTFSAATTLNVRVTRPNLVVDVKAPEAVQVGDEVPVHIQVANNGSGDASKILLKAVLTEGLKHPEGNDIQAVLTKLAPGESQTVTLRLQATAPGPHTCTLMATVEGGARVSTHAKVDVRQPRLNLAVMGPAKCIVKAEPTFTLEVTNPGSSATEPVQVALAFPEGLDFVSASDSGAFDAGTRTVSWNLPPAEAASKRHLTVKTKSSVAGNLAVRAVAQAGTRLNARAEAVIQAEGVPALMFEVTDLEDPIEVGKETTYEIRIANTGTMHCTNVKLMAALSDGLVIGNVTASVPYKIAGQTLVFDPISKLAVKGDLIVRIRAKGTTAGDHRCKVQLSCDQLRQPVVKEESTSFFQP